MPLAALICGLAVGYAPSALVGARPMLLAPAIHPPTPPIVSRARMVAPQANAYTDLAYLLGALVVVGFAGRNIFDSIFIENEEFKPPMPTLPKNPLRQKSMRSPEAEAERLRLELQGAAADGDLEKAVRVEKVREARETHSLAL